MRLPRLIPIPAGVVLAAACGNGDTETRSTALDVPTGATFCSVFTSQYRDALDCEMRSRPPTTPSPSPRPR